MPVIWRTDAELINGYNVEWLTVNGGRSSTIRAQFAFQLNPTSSAALDQFARNVWNSAWAPLITSGTQCIGTRFTRIDMAGPPYLSIAPNLFGFVSGTESVRADSAVIVQWLGGAGGDSNHRLYIEFTPASFQQDRVMNLTAVNLFLTSMRALMLGCDGSRGGVGPRMIVRQGAVASTPKRLGRPPRWADIEQLIVCRFVDPPPQNL